MKPILMRSISLSISLIFILGFFASANASKDENYYLRENLVINKIADAYNPPSMNIGDPEKYYWPKAMARFRKYGVNDALANGYIDEICVKGAFHFAIVGMTRLIYQYPDAPSIKNNLNRILQRNLTAGLSVSEGTENHLSMERTSIYLFAQKALKINPDDKVAKETLDMTREWILTWSKRLYEQGAGEWNSSTYGTYNLIGWLNLIDYAEDPTISAAATAVADYYAAEIALHYSWGSPGGSEMRGNKEADKNRTSTSYLAWLWFTDGADCPQGLEPAEYIQLVHPILSSYFPSDPIIELARKNDITNAWYQNSKPSYLFEIPSFCKQDFYISENFTLGNMVSAYGGYTGASYAIIPWRLVIKKDGDCPYEIGGGGRYRDSWTGQCRSPFTQTVQHKNTLISMTKLPLNHDEHYEKVTEIIEQWKKDWDRDYRLRHDPKDNVVTMIDGTARSPIAYLSLPSSFKYEILDNTLLIDAGKVYIIVTTLHSPKISTRAESGRITVMDESVVGDLAAYCMEVIEKSSVNDETSFKNRIRNSSLILDEDNHIKYVNQDGDKLEARFVSYGTCIEPLFDWGYGATEAMCLLSSPPLRQPDWGYDEGFGKIPEFSVNGVTVDYNIERPVYNGPRLSLDNSILQISSSDGTTYRVDYSDSTPSFGLDQSGITDCACDDASKLEWEYDDSVLKILSSDSNSHKCCVYNLSGIQLFKQEFNGNISVNLTKFENSDCLIINLDGQSFKIKN